MTAVYEYSGTVNTASLPALHHLDYVEGIGFIYIRRTAINTTYQLAKSPDAVTWTTGTSSGITGGAWTGYNQVNLPGVVYTRTAPDSKSWYLLCVGYTTASSFVWYAINIGTGASSLITQTDRSAAAFRSCYLVQSPDDPTKFQRLEYAIATSTARVAITFTNPTAGSPPVPAISTSPALNTLSAGLFTGSYDPTGWPIFKAKIGSSKITIRLQTIRYSTPQVVSVESPSIVFGLHGAILGLNDRFIGTVEGVGEYVLGGGAPVNFLTSFLDQEMTHVESTRLTLYSTGDATQPLYMPFAVLPKRVLMFGSNSGISTRVNIIDVISGFGVCIVVSSSAGLPMPFGVLSVVGQELVISSGGTNQTNYINALTAGTPIYVTYEY